MLLPMPRSLVYLLYNLLLPPLLLLGLPSFFIKGLRRGGLARGFFQRLGFFSQETLAKIHGRNPLWIHAVSVGEVFLALKLIEALRAVAPDLSIVLSTTTTTGYRVAAEKESPTLTVIHNPVDLPLISWHVLQTIHPCALVLIEAEIWPNLVGLAKRCGLPVLLVNARLSPRSERRYGTFRSLVEPIFSLLDGITVPFAEDVARWNALGIDASKIRVTGSVKFDHAGPAAAAATQRDDLAAWLAATGFSTEHRILLGGSTHDGEELLLAQITRELKRDFPTLELVLVPRHAERGSEIAARLREDGFDPILRIGSDPLESPTEDGSLRIWIANTTGELRSWYALGELVVIGKSFHGIGGQNPVEPILAGRPVVVGPHMENFSEVVSELREIGGLRQVNGADALPGALRELLLHPETGQEMASRGALAMARHAGSASRNAEWVAQWISQERGGV